MSGSEAGVLSRLGREECEETFLRRRKSICQGARREEDCESEKVKEAQGQSGSGNLGRKAQDESRAKHLKFLGHSSALVLVPANLAI